jgi:hypothetical protein
MTIELDKQAHALAGYAIALSVTLIFHSVLLGLVIAMLAEGAKIVFIDMPTAKKANLPMDWREKALDAIAQLLGAITGVLFWLVVK